MRTLTSLGKNGIFTIAFFGLSCSNPSSPVSPIEGSIAGHIALLDSAGYVSPLGVSVSIPSLNLYSMTDSSGEWHFDNLPIGSYDLVATKQGYGTMKWFEEHVVGPGTLYISSVAIPQIPGCTVTLDSIKYDSVRGVATIDCFGAVSGLVNVGNIYIVIDGDSITTLNGTHLFWDAGEAEAVWNGPWSISIPPQVRNALASGTRIYVSAYWVANSSSFYYDPVESQIVPISPSKISNAVPFIIP